MAQWCGTLLRTLGELLGYMPSSTCAEDSLRCSDLSGIREMGGMHGVTVDGVVIYECLSQLRLQPNESTATIDYGTLLLYAATFNSEVSGSYLHTSLVISHDSEIGRALIADMKVPRGSNFNTRLMGRTSNI